MDEEDVACGLLSCGLGAAVACTGVDAGPEGADTVTGAVPVLSLLLLDDDAGAKKNPPPPPFAAAGAAVLTVLVPKPKPKLGAAEGADAVDEDEDDAGTPNVKPEGPIAAPLSLFALAAAF